MSTMNSSKDRSDMKDQTNILELLQEMFPDAKFDYLSHKFHGTIHVFEVAFDNIEDLAADWVNVSNAIAAHFQTTLETEFEVWNLYLIYRCNFVVPKNIRYKLENDTISSRKILVDPLEINTFGGTLLDSINRHITNSDLRLLSKQQLQEIKSGAFEKNIEISAALSTVVNIGKKASDEFYAEVLSKMESSVL